MRRVWVFGLIAVLAVSAIVAGSAGYLYLSGGEASGDVPESEIPEDVYTGPEDLNASDGNVSSLDCFCGGGNADAYGNYSPRSYEDYDYELANSSDGPTEERYVNVYEPGEPPKWIPESEFSMKNHSAGTYEVTRYPNAEPTQQDLEAAWRLYNRSFEAAEENGWFEFRQSTEDNYRQLTAGNIHYINSKFYTDTKELAPNSPESLVYYKDPNNESNKILAGYMYLTESVNSEGVQFGGPLTVWHYHPAQKDDKKSLRSILRSDHIKKSSDFTNGSMKGDRSREMIHVWFIKNPWGPFATNMGIPKESIKTPKKMGKKEFKNYLMSNYEGE